MLKPVNDLAMIKLKSEEVFNDPNEKETAESGILVALPDKFDFFGYWSFAFENSFMNEEKLSELYTRWKKHIGKKVFWTALAERGNIIRNDDGRWAFIKLTSLIAEDDAESTAQNIHSDGAGSFGLEQ